MKKLISKQQSNSQRGFFLTVTGLFVILFLVFAAMNTNGQQIQELSSKLSVMKASPDPSVRAEGLHLESLVYDLQPTLYFENGQIGILPGDAPVRVNTDAASVSQVTKGNYSQVEIIVIKIQNLQDLQMHINLSDLSGYTNLKYVYFLCTFEICPELTVESTCEIKKIASMVTIGSNNSVSITYSVSIPS